MERMESIVTKRTNPTTEVSEKPARRRFSAEYKLRILAEADRCTELGQIGEVLRREGLYSSHLSNWRSQRDEGVLAGLKPKRRGRKAKPKNPLADEVAQLRIDSGFLQPNARCCLMRLLPNSGGIRWANRMLWSMPA